MKKSFKGIVAFCMALMIVCNVSVVHATESSVETEASQFSNEEWEKLIDEIIKIKEENPDKSDEEIVNIISASVKARDVASREISDIWNALTDSEKTLCVKYSFAELKVNQARNIATEQTTRKFGYNGLGDRSDAFSKEVHKDMGLKNNAVGRVIGQNNLKLSEDELADYIYDLIYSEDTVFVWLHD